MRGRATSAKICPYIETGDVVLLWNLSVIPPIRLYNWLNPLESAQLQLPD